MSMRILAAVLLLIVVAAANIIDNANAPITFLPAEPSVRLSHCPAGSVEGWQHTTQGKLDVTDEIQLFSNGAIIRCFENPGTLKFTATGSEALNVGANLIVNIGLDRAFDDFLLDGRLIELPVPEFSVVMLSFVNDLYRSPTADRNIWIRELEFN